MIFFAKSAGIKSFLAKIEGSLSPRTQTYLTNLIAAFLLRWVRMTDSQAGQSICTQPRHRANVARFLAECGWSSDGRTVCAERKRWWGSLRTYGICRAIRQESEAKEIEESARLSTTKSGLRKLRKLLRAAQSPEYRAAC
jgi:hypothetical protein